MNKLNEVRPGHGVYEWAGYSYNIGTGCEHDCRYCYARDLNEKRERDQGNDPSKWSFERVNPHKKQITQTADDIVMFPSMHDITPNYLGFYTDTLRALLKSGNQVVIVTKPHVECIITICNEFERYKDWILFRMTITSLKDETSQFWEPGAPLPRERVSALRYAYEEGYQTSVSVEPMLETVEQTVELYHSLTPYITEDIWFGKMNSTKQRVKIKTDDEDEAVRAIQRNQSDGNIIRLHKQLNGQPKVKWKDSIRKVVSRAA